MADKTTNYNLTKPLDNEYYDIGISNGNMDIIDEQLKERDTRVGPLASLISRIKTSIVNAINGLQTDFNEHKAESTAHGTATKAEAQTGTSHASYMTPLRTKEAIQALQAVTSVNGKTGAVTLNASDVNAMPQVGGTFTGQAIAQSNTSYTTAQLRNIILSTADASGAAPNGAIWIKYKA